MQEAMTQALNELEARAGDIDIFVAEELGYRLDESNRPVCPTLRIF